MPDKPAPDSALALGRDLRGLRKNRGLTLEVLARKISRSVGFLSQIERGLSKPALNDLRAIADALDVPLSWFYISGDAPTAERVHVVRADQRRRLGSPEHGITEELLSPDLGGSFEILRTVIEPDARLDEPLLRETEEAAYLVSGTLDLWIGADKFHLTAGDAFRFDHQPHRWHNPGPDPAVLIWVVSPPVY